MRDMSTFHRHVFHAWLAASLALGAAQAAEVGNFCVHAYSAGLACDGSDVRVTSLEPVTVIEDCESGDIGTAEVVFDVTIGNFSGADRYDIGVFLALNGDSALSGGQCLHDYLEPPMTPAPVYGDADGNGRPDIVNGPWFDGDNLEADRCADIQPGTDALKTLVAVRFDCVDSTLDGIVDLSACASWSSGTMARCGDLNEAIPATSPRCHCGVVETGIPMPGAEGPAGHVEDLALQPSGPDNLLLSWGDSCSGTDTDYAVYEGNLGDFSSHESVVCSTAGMSSAVIQPASGDRYYLIVPRNSEREGSYGLDGEGFERPPAAGSCLPQWVQSTCP